MLKKVSLPFLLLAIIAGIVFWLVRDPSDRKSIEENAATLVNQDQSLSANGTSAEEIDPAALGLLLKTIQLSQGEKGAELWRLNADAASMTRQEGHIFVEDPRLIYIMPPDNKELRVVSLKGDINQEAQILRFIDDVHATYTNSTMTGDLLVYNGTARTMTFPRGGHFADEQAVGSAEVVIWHLDNRLIEAHGDVDVTFSSSKNLPGMKGPDNKEDTQLFNATAKSGSAE